MLRMSFFQTPPPPLIGIGIPEPSEQKEKCFDRRPSLPGPGADLTAQRKRAEGGGGAKEVFGPALHPFPSVDRSAAEVETVIFLSSLLLRAHIREVFFSHPTRISCLDCWLSRGERGEEGGGAPFLSYAITMGF